MLIEWNHLNQLSETVVLNYPSRLNWNSKCQILEKCENICRF